MCIRERTLARSVSNTLSAEANVTNFAEETPHINNTLFSSPINHAINSSPIWLKLLPSLLLIRTNYIRSQNSDKAIKAKARHEFLKKRDNLLQSIPPLPEYQYIYQNKVGLS